MTLQIQVLAWDRHNIVAELNPLMGFQPSPVDNSISNGYAYINKRLKTWKSKINTPTFWMFSLKKHEYLLFSGNRARDYFTGKGESVHYHQVKFCFTYRLYKNYKLSTKFRSSNSDPYPLLLLRFNIELKIIHTIGTKVTIECVWKSTSGKKSVIMFMQ
jgi:hypothetical protein